MPPPSVLVGAVVLDHGEDSLARGAPEGFGQIAADVVFLDLEHPDEARRGACRRLLHEGPAAVEDAIPSLAEERPEGFAGGREGLGGSALRIGQPHVPVLACLAREGNPTRIAVRDLHVILPLEPAPAVGDDPSLPLQRVVVRAAHVAALAAGNRRVITARPVGVGGIEGPRGGALVPQAVVEVGDAPRPQPGRRAQVLHLPRLGRREVVKEGRVVLPVLGLMPDLRSRPRRAIQIGEKQDAPEADARRGERLGGDPFLDGLVAVHIVDSRVLDVARPEALRLEVAVVHEEAAGQAQDGVAAAVELVLRSARAAGEGGEEERRREGDEDARAPGYRLPGIAYLHADRGSHASTPPARRRRGRDRRLHRGRPDGPRRACTEAKPYVRGLRTTSYPCAVSSRSTPRGIRFDTSMALLVAEKRGALTASTMVMSKSMAFKSTWRTPMAIWVAPGAPITMCGRSPSYTMDGTTELKRALPGARLPARPGRGSNTPMQPLYMKPRPSVITPEGIPSECVMATQLPSPSITDTCVVSRLGEPPALKRCTSAFLPSRISSASPAA